MIYFNFIDFEMIYFVGDDWTEEQKGGYLPGLDLESGNEGDSTMLDKFEEDLGDFFGDLEDDGESPIANCFSLNIEEDKGIAPLILDLEAKGYKYDPEMRLPKGAAVRLFGREDYDAPPPTHEDWKSVTLQCPENTTGELYGGHDFLRDKESNILKKRCSFCGKTFEEISKELDEN